MRTVCVDKSVSAKWIYTNDQKFHFVPFEYETDKGWIYHSEIPKQFGYSEGAVIGSGYIDRGEVQETACTYPTPIELLGTIGQQVADAWLEFEREKAGKSPCEWEDVDA